MATEEFMLRADLIHSDDCPLRRRSSSLHHMSSSLITSKSNNFAHIYDALRVIFRQFWHTCDAWHVFGRALLSLNMFPFIATIFSRISRCIFWKGEVAIDIGYSEEEQTHKAAVGERWQGKSWESWGAQRGHHNLRFVQIKSSMFYFRPYGQLPLLLG